MRIYLRPASIEDGPMIVQWRNHPKGSSHCMNKKPITVESNEAFFKANVETGRYKPFIVERIDEEFGVSSYPIATIYLKEMDFLNKRCELCVFTSDDQDLKRSGFSIEAVLKNEAVDENGNFEDVIRFSIIKE